MVGTKVPTRPKKVSEEFHKRNKESKMGIVYDIVMLFDSITNKPKPVKFTSYMGMYLEGCLTGKEFFTFYVAKQSRFVSVWIPLLGILTIRKSVCEEFFYYG